MVVESINYSKKKLMFSVKIDGFPIIVVNGCYNKHFTDVGPIIIQYSFIA